MITKDKLDYITTYIKEKVWRDPDVMYPYFPPGRSEDIQDLVGDLVDIISSLHNLLYEAITGERYDYAFHWCNKIGSFTRDNIFDVYDHMEDKHPEDVMPGQNHFDLME